MTVELQMLVLTAVLTALMWVPYILAHIFRHGPVQALSYAADGKPLPDWAARLKKAHANAIENLPIFAIAILVAHVLSISTPVTVLAAQVYLIARILHAVGYVSNLPLARTLTFTAGLIATFAIFQQILTTA
ncbi:MAG: MAPEG family protein [Porticoccaceae bacterium]|nr:MAPEG family protein [Porticoccaceae bacterium]